jgi:bifunctional DNase/RNase
MLCEEKEYTMSSEKSIPDEPIIEVKVSGLAIDGYTKDPIVILQEIDGEKILPIWIGKSEASSIAIALMGKKFDRPLTHDLMKILVDAFQSKVSRVVINSLQQKTFYANIVLENPDGLISIDARPSDSIALALRTKSPIFVREDLIQYSPEEGTVSEEEKTKSLQEFLRQLNPEDFGKFEI